jgi:hypothetical protein
MAAKITRDALEGYLDCETKAFLKLAGEEGHPLGVPHQSGSARVRPAKRI